jgi:hypothetical protein
MTTIPRKQYRSVDDDTFFADLEHTVASGEWTRLHASTTIAIDTMLERGATKVDVRDDYPDGSITVTGIIEGRPVTIRLHPPPDRWTAPLATRE